MIATQDIPISEGAGFIGSNFTPYFIKTYPACQIIDLAKREETIYLNDDQIGCPTNANNLVKYVLDMVSFNVEESRFYHFTDGVPIKWYEFASIVLKEGNLEKRLRLVKDRNYRTFAARLKNRVLAMPDKKEKE